MLIVETIAKIHAYADRIVIRQDGAVVAEHPRCFGRGETIYDPWHYVPVLARKPGALRNGAPFKNWPLPAGLERLRRRLKGSDDGDRQMVKIPLRGADRRPRRGGGGLCRGARRWRSLRRCRPQHPGAAPRPRAGGGDPDPEALRLHHAPIADCARYDRLRSAS